MTTDNSDERSGKLQHMRDVSNDPRSFMGDYLRREARLVTAGTDESDKWRQLSSAATSTHVTQMWERYQADCRSRGLLEQDYIKFIAATKSLTHPEIPAYWDLHVAHSTSNDDQPNPFLEFATRMQASLPPHEHSNWSR